MSHDLDPVDPDDGAPDQHTLRSPPPDLKGVNLTLLPEFRVTKTIYRVTHLVD